jgi:diguanylate cyclase (GGDEF)-like protein
VKTSAGLKVEKSNAIAVGHIRSEKFLKPMVGTPLAELYILDRHGKLLIHSDKNHQLQRYNYSAIPIVQDFLGSKHTSDVRRYTYANGDYLGAFTRTEYGGLGVFSSIQSDRAFEAVGVLLKRALIFAFIVFFSVMIISQYFSHSLTTPLRELVQATYKIALGELGSKVDVQSTDEIGQLAVSFNRMSSDLFKSRQELVDINLSLEEKVKERTKELEELATKDPLTGVYNRRYFNTRLQEEIDRANRTKTAVGLIYLDIDHFKKYNDANGHPAGDALLKHFVQVVKLAVRKTDVVARLGGEEFCVILMDTKLEGAQLAAEKVRSLVEKTPFVHGKKQPMGMVSCSLGVSEYPTLASDVEGLVKVADEALYQVKQKSRNAVGVGVALPKHKPLYVPIDKPNQPEDSKVEVPSTKVS